MAKLHLLMHKQLLRINKLEPMISKEKWNQLFLCWNKEKSGEKMNKKIHVRIIIVHIQLLFYYLTNESGRA